MAARNDEQPPIRLSEVSAVLAAFAAAAYALGLFALWVPAAKPTHDFVMSWYAVSLMPTTTVAGIGIRWTLVGPQLPFIVIFLVYGLLGWGFFAIWKRPQSDEGNFHERRRAAAAGLGIGMIVWTSLLLWVLLKFENPMQAYSAWPPLRYVLLLVVWVIILSPLALRYRTFRSISRETKRRVARHVVLFILVNFAIGLVLVSLSGQLVLPVVEMDSRDTSVSDITGELWTHTDGYWYVLDQDNNLCAVPDDNVRIVRIMKSGLATGDPPELTLCVTR